MKSAAMGLVFLICISLGLRGAQKIRCRARTAAALLAGVRKLKSSAGFFGRDVRAAAQEARAGSARGFFERYAAKLQSGASPEEAWKAAKDEIVGLSESGFFAAEEFFCAFGRQSAPEQARSFAAVEQALLRELDEAQKQLREQGRLRVALGALSGAAAVIVML